MAEAGYNVTVPLPVENTLPGPSRTITVEPLEAPRREEAPPPPPPETEEEPAGAPDEDAEPAPAS
jgi:hypothetical protein